MAALQIVWFKRDLRIVDHQPLEAAVERGLVLPLYVVEPELWQHQTPLHSCRQGLVIDDAQITLEPDDLQRCHSLQWKGLGSSGSGAPAKLQSTAISMTSAKRVFTVLRKPTTSKRRVINAAARKQTICGPNTPP